MRRSINLSWNTARQSACRREYAERYRAAVRYNERRANAALDRPQFEYHRALPIATVTITSTKRIRIVSP